ncbi:hypothetical protein [Mycolicibacterium setense]|uniref:hypothetical protein n=1 Tax=Mycolicibacterium setense TaxID=431269 RepID=UPI00103BE463|nr:hypothetical protein [Mycolicibacterium setense]
MTAATQLCPAVLDEAAAIVQAEWMRLGHGQEHAGAAAGTLAELPAPAYSRPSVCVLTAISRPGRTPPNWAGGGPEWRRPAQQVWPTQRSPPAEPVVKHRERQRR